MRLTITAILLLATLLPSFGQSCNCDLTITTNGYHDGARTPVRPGGTVCIRAGAYQYLRFRNFQGTPSAPIRFVNCGGQVDLSSSIVSQSGIDFMNCRYFILTGSGDSRFKYGIRVMRGGSGPSTGINIKDKSSDCEVERIEVANVGFAGIMAKTDPQPCDRSTWRDAFTMHNVKIHDNYVHDVGGEGFYIGHTSFGGQTRACNGQNVTMFPHNIMGLEIYRNLTERTGYEGLQYACAPNAQVHHNTIRDAGRANSTFQNNGAQIGGGASGRFYNNTIRGVMFDGIHMVGSLGNVTVANNIIADVRSNGIFVDERPGTPANTPIDIINNTIVNAGLDGVSFYNETQVNTLINNTIVKATRFSVNILNKTIRVTQANNFTAVSVDAARFINAAAGDFRPAPGSPLIDRGQDARRFGVANDVADQPRPRGAAFDIGAFEEGSPAVPLGSNSAARIAADEAPELATPDDVVLVQLYPSPSTDQITVSLSNGATIASISIVDAHGLPKLHRTVGNTRVTLPVSQLSTGFYLVRIATPTGTYGGRFIKQ